MATLNATKDYFAKYDFILSDYFVDGFEAQATINVGGFVTFIAEAEVDLQGTATLSAEATSTRFGVSILVSSGTLDATLTTEYVALRVPYTITAESREHMILLEERTRPLTTSSRLGLVIEEDRSRQISQESRWYTLI